MEVVPEQGKSQEARKDARKSGVFGPYLAIFGCFSAQKQAKIRHLMLPDNQQQGKITD
jgi:hypothetical protein